MWERRTPLCPGHVRRLVDQGIEVFVQPSATRVFKNSEYLAAGATLSMDLSSADVILGVKQIECEEILPDKTYMFFSHVIKGQSQNMPLLNAVMERNSTLIDYECLKEYGRVDGSRVIAFGPFAGKAGMIDSLRGLGERLLQRGCASPFLQIGSSYMYESLADAETAITRVGREIDKGVLSEPLTFVFTGRGNVSTGAQSVFNLLPHEMVSPTELADAKKNGDPSKLYGTVVGPSDYCVRTGGGSFSFDEYLTQPDLYTSNFHDVILPHSSVIMNCMYWDPEYPRIITNDQLALAWSQGNRDLLVVGDITCDVEGSIECLTRSTPIEDPFFLWDPEGRRELQDRGREGVLVLGVDILPSELPREASQHFGDRLQPILVSILHGVDSDSEMIDTATIVKDGALQEIYEYIPKLAQSTTTTTSTGLRVLLRGHLFDTGLINRSLDLLEALRVEFCVADMHVQVSCHKRLFHTLDMPCEAHLLIFCS